MQCRIVKLTIISYDCGVKCKLSSGYHTKDKKTVHEERGREREREGEYGVRGLGTGSLNLLNPLALPPFLLRRNSFPRDRRLFLELCSDTTTALASHHITSHVVYITIMYFISFRTIRSFMYSIRPHYINTF